MSAPFTKEDYERLEGISSHLKTMLDNQQRAYEESEKHVNEASATVMQKIYEGLRSFYGDEFDEKRVELGATPCALSPTAECLFYLDEQKQRGNCLFCKAQDPIDEQDRLKRRSGLKMGAWLIARKKAKIEAAQREVEDLEDELDDFMTNLVMAHQSSVGKPIHKDDIQLGLHKCESSPVGECAYNEAEDANNDFCLFCSQPHERR